MVGIVDAIKAKVGKALDVAQPIRPGARAISAALAPKPAAAAPPKENKGYTERLTGEKAAIGAAQGLPVHKIDSKMRTVKPR